MIRVAILSEDKQLSFKLHEICVDFFSYKAIYYDINIFHHSELFFNCNRKYDIIFLGYSQNLHVAQTIRSTNKECYLCFIDDSTTHVKDYFKVHAFSVVKQRISRKEVFQVLDDVWEYMKFHINKPAMLEFEILGGEIQVQTDEILYFEYYDSGSKYHCRCTILHTYLQDYEIKKPISQVYKQLSLFDFSIPHKSFIINMHSIKLCKKNEIVMINDDIIPLSQKRRKQFLIDFEKYIQRR